jgi:DNA polymerase elongation subunit (family B)
MYQDIYFDKKQKQIHLWDDAEGHQVFPYQPYSYVPSVDGQYIAIDGTKLSKVAGEELPNSYESDLNPEMRVLIDLYYETDDISKGHRELFYDIEIAKDEDGYATPENVRTAITSIAYHDKAGKDRRVLILDSNKQIKKQSNEYQVEVFHDEASLLMRFINIFAEIQPTIISGWNIDKFDTPYLINRIKKVLGPSVVKKLSSIGQVDWIKSRKRYKIAGVSSLDYLFLYKNFTYTELPNYRLDTVAKKELGRGKVEYDGDLDELLRTDIEKFIEYNMTDVDLVYALDEKLQLINLARTICHKGHVPYEEVFYASKYLDGAAIVDLKRNGRIAPNKRHRFVEDESISDSLEGAYVMAPVPGLYKWIYDLDLTSLYPSIIMTLNISPETKIGVVHEWNELCLIRSTPVPIKLITNTGYEEIEDVKDWLQKNNYTIASNGAVYRNDIRGFLPTILEKWFDERVIYKNKRDEYSVGSEEYKFYDALQLTQKVLLNSFYGVLGLKTFRFHDLDNAGAITGTGQSIIKFSAKCINNYYTKEINKDSTTNVQGKSVDYAFYTDTDSTFCSSIPLIEKRYPGYDETDEQFMIEKTNEIASEVQKHVNEMYDKYALVFHNTTTHKFQIKQEYVAKSGLWIAKKRYAQWVIFKEGKPTNKLDIKGLDVVRSSFPTDFKTIMEETLWLILKEHGKEAITKQIMDFRSKLERAAVVNVMKNTGVNDIEKYTKGRTKFSGYTSGTPVHVKAAINYNDMLQKNKIKNVQQISNGEKIKWAYLKNNPYGFDVIALRGYEDPISIEEFVNTYIDRMKIFDRELRGKLDDFYAAMAWGKLPENNNMSKFFSF